MPTDPALIRRLVEVEAVKQGLNPQYVAAVAQQESGFNPQARSKAGALGVMQLMPATARTLGVDPQDPVANIRGGVRYLKQQLDTFGDPVLALAAYNAGPGAVHRYGGVPPFKETRGYVQKIMRALTPASAEAAEPLAPPGALRADDRAALEERLRQIQALKARAVPPQPSETPPPSADPDTPPPPTPADSPAYEVEVRALSPADAAAARQQAPPDASPAPVDWRQYAPVSPLEAARAGATWGGAGRTIAATGTSALGTTAGAGVGAAIGGALAGPPGAALGGLIGGMGGSYIARRSNVETGLEEPGAVGDALSIVVPAVPGLVTAGRHAAGALARGSRAGQALTAADDATATAQTAARTEQDAAEQAYRTGQQDYQSTIRAREAERLAGVQQRRTVAQERQATTEARRQTAVEARQARAVQDAEAATQQQAQDYAAQVQRYEQTVAAHRRGVVTARGIPQRYRPETPAHVIYTRLTEVAPEAPVTLTRTQEVATALQETFAQAPTLLPPRLHNLLTDLRMARSTQSMREVKRYLTDIGAMTRSPGTSTRNSARQLYGALHDDLEESALRLPETDQARTLLLQANAAFRREMAVGELSRMIRRGISVGDDGIPRIAPGRIVKQLDDLTSVPAEELTPRERLFLRSFSPEDLTRLRTDVEVLTGVEHIPPRPGAPPPPVPPRRVDPYTPGPAQEPRLPAGERVVPQTTPAEVARIPQPPPPAPAVAPVPPTLAPREQRAFRSFIEAAGFTEAAFTWGLGPVSSLALTLRGKDKFADVVAAMLLSPRWQPYLRRLMQPDGRVNLEALIALAGGRAAFQEGRREPSARRP